MDIIKPEVDQYCKAHTTPEPDVLAKLNRETNTSQVYPRMLSGHQQGTFLRMISQMMQPRRILEVGTFTGYSAINMAMGLAPDGVLHTIEVNPELEWIISKYLIEGEVREKVILHIGEAETIIPQLKESWDLVFIDADKPNYLKYYQMILPKVRKGGIILADNALWDGKVLNPSTTNKDAIGIMAFNDYVQKDPTVDNIILPYRDGIMMIRKK